MPQDSLTALVTGASSGLGAATARLLAERGARVIITYSTNKAAAEETADACRTHSAEAIVVQGDVASDDDCKRMVAAALPWGRLDALINNAGIITKQLPDNSQLDQLAAEDFQHIYAVNVVGAFQMIRAAHALLEAGAKASKRASAVVNIASISGISGISSSVAYAASKGALITMTKSLARVLAPTIRVNAACPGYIDTPWFIKGRGQEAADKLREEMRERAPLKRASSPEEIAELVAFLASPASGNMSGEAVRMDAGMHLVTG